MCVCSQNDGEVQGVGLNSTESSQPAAVPMTDTPTTAAPVPVPTPVQIPPQFSSMLPLAMPMLIPPAIMSPAILPPSVPIPVVKLEPAGPRPIASIPVPATPWSIVWSSDERTFFFNATNRTSLWTIPEELQGNPIVQKILDNPPGGKSERKIIMVWYVGVGSEESA